MASTRRVIYSVATSLDGCIAGPQGEYDWIPMDPDLDMRALMGRFDTLLMGRKSWAAAQAQGGGGMPGTKTVVFSRTLRASDCRGATLSDDPAATVAALKAAPGKDVWLWGGGELFRSMLDARLVDRVELAVVPVLLGGGIPFLPHPAERAGLRLERHQAYPKTGTVILEYAVA